MKISFPSSPYGRLNDLLNCAMQGNPRQSWILDSKLQIANFRYWFPDSLAVELYFLYFNEFLLCYVLHFLHTLTYEYEGKYQKKEKKTKHIYIYRRLTHNYILTKKKERNTP